MTALARTARGCRPAGGARRRGRCSRPQPFRARRSTARTVPGPRRARAVRLMAADIVHRLRQGEPAARDPPASAPARARSDGELRQVGGGAIELVGLAVHVAEHAQVSRPAPAAPDSDCRAGRSRGSAAPSLAADGRVGRDQVGVGRVARAGRRPPEAGASSSWSARIVGRFRWPGRPANSTPASNQEIAGAGRRPASARRAG